MALEKCSNCGRNIGNLETVYVFNGHIVCDDCNQILCRQKIGSPAPVQAEPQLQNKPAQGVQTIEKTGEELIVNVKGIKSTSGFGIAALVLGILSCISCWIPFCGIMTIPVCLIGIIVGIVGLFASALGRRTGIGMSVAGIFVCVLAIAIALSSTERIVRAIIDERAKIAKSTQQEIVSPLNGNNRDNLQASKQEVESESVRYKEGKDEFSTNTYREVAIMTLDNAPATLNIAVYSNAPTQIQIVTQNVIFPDDTTEDMRGMTDGMRVSVTYKFADNNRVDNSFWDMHLMKYHNAWYEGDRVLFLDEAMESDRLSICFNKSGDVYRFNLTPAKKYLVKLKDYVRN